MKDAAGQWKDLPNLPIILFAMTGYASLYLQDPRKLASRLGREIKAEQERDWAKGNATDWAYESFKIAKEDIYSELPVGPLERGRWGKDLPQDYYSDKMRRIVDLQLEKAGVRLAWVLNDIFKKPN